MEVLTKGLAAILAMEFIRALEVLTMGLEAISAMKCQLATTEALNTGQHTVPWDQRSNGNDYIMVTQACSIALCKAATSQHSGNLVD
ncbi:hypothetical protein AgCh_019453 [Apium graveolens]